MTLKEHILTPEFKEKTSKVLEFFGYPELLNSMLNLISLLADGEFTINEFRMKIVEVMGLNEELASEIALKIEKDCLSEYVQELEVMADVYYESVNKFVKEFDLTAYVDKVLSASGLVEVDRKRKVFLLAVGQYLLLQLEGNQLLNIVTKPEKVGGVGLSDEEGSKVLGDLISFSKIIERNKLEPSIFPEIVRTLISNNFSVQNIFIKTLKDVEEIDSIIEEYKKNYQTTPQTQTPKATNQKDLSSLIDQLSQDLGYDNNDDTKSEK